MSGRVPWHDEAPVRPSIRALPLLRPRSLEPDTRWLRASCPRCEHGRSPPERRPCERDPDPRSVASFVTSLRRVPGCSRRRALDARGREDFVLIQHKAPLWVGSGGSDGRCVSGERCDAETAQTRLKGGVETAFVRHCSAAILGRCCSLRASTSTSSGESGLTTTAVVRWPRSGVASDAMRKRSGSLFLDITVFGPSSAQSGSGALLSERRC